jgi:hypothetical protein
MKKLAAVFLFLFLSFQSHSQILMTVLFGDKLNSDGIEFGLVGGINWAAIERMDSRHYDMKWNLGYYFDIRLKNQWSLYTGVLMKANNGLGKLTNQDLVFLNASTYTDGTEEDLPIKGEYKQKINAFMLPVLAKYTFKNHFHLELGPQFALMYRSFIEFTSDIEGRDLIMKEYNSDDIHKIDAGILAGMGYRLMKGKGWTIAGKYYQGFTNVYKNRKGSHNRSFFVELNIPIGAGKKKD